jgi:hypothetical protein
MEIYVVRQVAKALPFLAEIRMGMGRMQRVLISPIHAIDDPRAI